MCMFFGPKPTDAMLVAMGVTIFAIVIPVLATTAVLTVASNVIHSR